MNDQRIKDLHNRIREFTIKAIFFFVASISTINLVQSQDIIYMNDGSEIESKVYEITSEFIKYKNFDELDGPLRNIYTKDVFKIKYESGKQEMFSNRIIKEENKIEQQTLDKTKLNTENSKSNSDRQTVTSLQSQQRLQTTENATLISFGYGNGYGGLGVNLGTNISSRTTLHIGGGWFPLSVVHEGANDMFMVAGGVRIFFTESKDRSRAYLDLQFGMLGGEYNEVNLYQNGILISHTEKQQALYGPSILFGTEVFWGKGNVGGRIAGGGSYNLVEIEWTDIGFIWSLDIGLVFRL